MDIFKQFIKSYGNQTSVNDDLIRQYLLDNWESDEKVLDISKRAYVSPASISRFVKKTRLSSYKNFLRQKKLSRTYLGQDIDYNIAFSEIAKQKQKLIADTLEGIDKQQLIDSCIEVEKAECLYIIGMGYSRNQAEAMCMRLNRIGKKATFIENLQELPFVNEKKDFENCVCIAISQTGDSSSVNKVCNFFISNQVQVIGICCESTSPMHKLCKHVLQIPKIYSGMYLEAIYSEVTVSATLDFIYTYVLFSNYQQSINNYNMTVDTINGKTLI